jgi:hypothetical protein
LRESPSDQVDQVPHLLYRLRRLGYHAEPWMLFWFGNAPGFEQGDLPWLVVWQHRPTELALSTYVHRGAPDPSVVSGLWLTHMSVFGVNLMFIAIALAGLTAACVRMGLLSSAWKTVGLVGAGALGVGAMCTPAILNASPVFALAVGGFLVWGAFVVVTSISLLHHSATD